MGNDPVNNVDPDGGAIAGTYRPPVPVGSLTNNTAQTVGQLTTAQGVSLPAGTSGTAGSSSNNSGGGGALNTLGNLVAGYLGHKVADALLPLPKGPDAGQLQPTPKESNKNITLQTSYNPISDNSFEEGYDDGSPEDPCTKKYNGYDPSKKLEDYNCAGLAFRNYQFMGDRDKVKTLLETFKKTTKPTQGDIKYWFWTYDLTFEYEDGSPADPKVYPDFHIVAGPVEANGKEPIKVYSKNGRRPVYGPKSGPSWKPPAREKSTSNDPSETPSVDRSGRQIYKRRSNIKQSIYILPCLPNF